MAEDAVAIGCVVLAAGGSGRLGQPKALIEVGQGTLIQWLVGRLESHGLAPVVVTRGELLEDVAASVACRVIVNPRPEDGRTGTLQVGIAHLDREIGPGYGLLVVPVDRPGFSDSTLRSLISSERTACPTKDGRGAHPIVILAAEVGRIRSAAPDAPLRELIEPFRLEVEDPHLHLNVDLPGDMIGLDDSLVNL